VLHLANSTEAHSKRECKRLCNNFASYFVEKIRKIKETIKSQLDNTSADPLRSDPMYTGLVLCSLVAPSTDEVLKLINSLPGKSSPMDCIPTTVKVLRRSVRTTYSSADYIVFPRRSFSLNIQNRKRHTSLEKERSRLRKCH
jgi:hypothetical protein